MPTADTCDVGCIKNLMFLCQKTYNLEEEKH